MHCQRYLALSSHRVLLDRLPYSPESTISVDGGDVSLTVEDGKHIAIDVGGVVTNLDQLDANMKALDAEGLTASTAAILLGTQYFQAVGILFLSSPDDGCPTAVIFLPKWLLGCLWIPFWEHLSFLFLLSSSGSEQGPGSLPFWPFPPGSCHILCALTYLFSLLIPTPTRDLKDTNLELMPMTPGLC